MDTYKALFVQVLQSQTKVLTKEDFHMMLETDDRRKEDLTGAEQEVERRSGKLAMLSANMAEAIACLEAVKWCLDQAIGILINATVLKDSLLLVRFLRKVLVPDISDIWLLSTKFSSLSLVTS
ncbi:hypothetical protein RHSIM_Rhsim08G0208200 [Rhododendron simsii]|uniref:Uncharacterized protein n=1 Tax=Rhododendron simsii TaxID=118357 RepID=A0A834GIP9_RHOSS|nr:hypothetical protein RHSIM_Rhsim08G0208200 [Rhododendron simsii]